MKLYRTLALSSALAGALKSSQGAKTKMIETKAWRMVMRTLHDFRIPYPHTMNASNRARAEASPGAPITYLF